MSAANGRGFVSLVGAGPGDPGLITVAGLDRLRHADVVVYDRLANPALLAEARPDAERVDVGKSSDHHRVPQDGIADLLVERARAGKVVVRLKGGDPFVFGRGGEEAQRLRRDGIEFEIVPGISPAIAAPAYAGIPVTHREYASSFAVVTGQEDTEKEASTLDWAGIAHGADTLVFLMGRRSLPQIIERLLAHGRPPATPLALIEWATTPRQRVIEATLGTGVAAAEREEVQAPLVMVIGEVVRLRRELRWFEQRPLFGQRVLVTRTRRQAGEMARKLRREGAEPLEMPTIEIVPADPAPVHAAIRRLAERGYDWTVFTSANGVEEFFAHLDRLQFDSRVFGSARVAAIGLETAAALRRYGLTADVVPERFVGEALVEALSREKMAGARVLLARAQEARAVVPDGLRALGATVDDVPLYAARRPAAADPAVVQRLAAGEVDIATFTASATVRGCLELLGGRTDLFDNVCVACIGPVTADTARSLGLHVDLVSEEHTVPGLIAALRTHLLTHQAREAARHA